MARRDQIKSLPPVERLRELLAYDADTGELRWLVSRSRTAKAGQVAGCVNVNGYRYVRLDMVYYLAHRLIWKIVTGHDPEEFIDHANGDKVDNRWGNLRPATWGQNRRNAIVGKNNTSGFKGVMWAPSHKKWRAVLALNQRKARHLGHFNTREEAAAAWAIAAKELHGEFFRDS